MIQLLQRIRTKNAVSPNVQWTVYIKLISHKIFNHTWLESLLISASSSDSDSSNTTSLVFPKTEVQSQATMRWRKRNKPGKKFTGRKREAIYKQKEQLLTAMVPIITANILPFLCASNQRWQENELWIVAYKWRY